MSSAGKEHTFDETTSVRVSSRVHGRATHMPSQLDPLLFLARCCQLAYLQTPLDKREKSKSSLTTDGRRGLVRPSIDFFPLINSQSTTAEKRSAADARTTSPMGPHEAPFCTSFASILQGRGRQRQGIRGYREEVPSLQRRSCRLSRSVGFRRLQVPAWSTRLAKRTTM